MLLNKSSRIFDFLLHLTHIQQRALCNVSQWPAGGTVRQTFEEVTTGTKDRFRKYKAIERQKCNMWGKKGKESGELAILKRIRNRGVILFSYHLLFYFILTSLLLTLGRTEGVWDCNSRGRLHFKVVQWMLTLMKWGEAQMKERDIRKENKFASMNSPTEQDQVLRPVSYYVPTVARHDGLEKCTVFILHQFSPYFRIQELKTCQNWCLLCLLFYT